MKQAHIFYSGTVQGVGFRFTVRMVASGLGLCGWVKNLPDGRVEVLAEGEENNIEEMIKSIESHFGGYIRNKNLNYNDPTGEYAGFNIRF